MKILKLLVLFGISGFLFLYFTNPSLKTFNEYIVVNSTDCNCEVVTGKTKNYLVSSIFEYKVLETRKKGDPIVREYGLYRGFLGNLYPVFIQRNPGVYKTNHIKH